MNDNPETPNVRKAARRLGEAEAMHAKATQKLADAEASILPVPDLADLRQALQDASAAHALGEVEAQAVENARQALQSAEAGAKASSARSAELQAVSQGLRRRVEAAQAEIEAARGALRAARVAWLNEHMKAADREYMAAAEIVMRAACKRDGAASVLLSLNEPVTGHTSLTSKVVLPTIGLVGSDRFLVLRTGASSDVPKDLPPWMVPPDESAAAELDALIEEASGRHSTTPAPALAG